MSNLRTKGWMVLPIAALVFAALGAVLLARGQLALGQTTTTVRIGSGQGVQSTDVTVPLEALDVPAPPGLGAITVDIVYDDSLEPTAWDGSGSPLGMVECNLNSAPYTVTCAGVSTAGVSGDVLIADLTFHLVGETPCIEECDPLDVQVVTFADPDGNPIPFTDEDGQICITCPGPPAILRVEPAEKTCSVGQPCEVDIVVDQVQNLGAFEFTVDFAPAVIQFPGWEEGPFLKSTGRGTLCSSYHVGDGSEKYACASGGAEAGPDGTGVLATFLFECAGEPGCELDLHDTALYDATTKANPIAHTVQDGHVTCTACAMDIDGDGDVDIRDVQLVFARWPSPPGPYDPLYDVDDDGDIDIRDVQLVFAWWPCTCGVNCPPDIG